VCVPVCLGVGAAIGIGMGMGIGMGIGCGYGLWHSGSGSGVCKATYSRFNVIWASTSAARNANIFQPIQCAKNGLQAKKQQAGEAKTNWGLRRVEFIALLQCRWVKLGGGNWVAAWIGRFGWFGRRSWIGGRTRDRSQNGNLSFCI